MPNRHRRTFTLFAAATAAWSLAGCAVRGPRMRSPNPPVIDIESGDAPLPEGIADVFDCADPIDYLLLGEVHDHPLQHRLRAAWLEALAKRRRFVLAMEQFDATSQADIDAARGRGADPRAVAQAAGFQFKGWDWDLYEPYVGLALRRRLPLLGANLSSSEARDIARGGSHPLAGIEPGDWTDEDRERLAEDIRESHCAMLPPAAIAPMAAAQRARDATMARVIADARCANGLPVVLLAGNGHVRRDRGVPRYLRDLAPRDSVFSVGMVERASADDPDGAPGERAFDLTIVTPAHPRPDPCEVFRGRPAPASAA